MLSLSITFGISPRAYHRIGKCKVLHSAKLLAYLPEKLAKSLFIEWETLPYEVRKNTGCKWKCQTLAFHQLRQYRYKPTVIDEGNNVF
jgi:hypothetical protein